MRKISWLVILLIGGCTLILEQSNLVSLNDSSEFRLLDEQVFIRSCRQLKEESYDIFYAAENQKCLKENAKQMQKLSEQIEQTNDLIKKEKLLDDLLASSEKFDACKISKGLADPVICYFCYLRNLQAVGNMGIRSRKEVVKLWSLLF